MANNDNGKTPGPETPAQAETNTQPELLAIETLAGQRKTPGWAFEGLKVRKRWAAGKLVTELEYVEALREFLEGPLVKG